MLSFKAILLEGSEVAILSLATIKQLGRRNVLFGVVAGGIGSVVILLLIGRIFTLLTDQTIDVIAGLILLAFSARFFFHFFEYSTGRESFKEEMAKETGELIEMDTKRLGTSASSANTIPFSVLNALPVLTITLTEGFEASLVIATAGTFNVTWTLIGGLVSLAILVAVSAISYEYLIRFPRWVLDLLAGVILLSFGSIFLLSAFHVI